MRKYNIQDFKSKEYRGKPIPKDVNAPIVEYLLNIFKKPFIEKWFDKLREKRHHGEIGISVKNRVAAAAQFKDGVIKQMFLFEYETKDDLTVTYKRTVQNENVDFKKPKGGK